MARRPIRHVPRDSSRRRRWVYIAVAVFILVDVLLIAWAISTTRADGNTAASQAGDTGWFWAADTLARSTDGGATWL